MSDGENGDEPRAHEDAPANEQSPDTALYNLRGRAVRRPQDPQGTDVANPNPQDNINPTDVMDHNGNSGTHTPVADTPMATAQVSAAHTVQSLPTQADPSALRDALNILNLSQERRTHVVDLTQLTAENPVITPTREPPPARTHPPPSTQPSVPHATDTGHAEAVTTGRMLKHAPIRGMLRL